MGCKYDKHINVLESQAILLGLQWLLRLRAYTGRPIPILSNSLVLYYTLFKCRFGASTLWRLDRRKEAWCLAGNLRIDPISVRNEQGPAHAPSRRFLNYYSTAWNRGPEKNTVSTSANSFIFAKKKKQPLRDRRNLTTFCCVLFTTILTNPAETAGVTSTRCYAQFNFTFLKRKTSYTYRTVRWSVGLA